MGFPGGSAGKESTCNAGELGLIPGLGISPGEGKGYPLQYSGLANSMDCIVHGVTKSWTQLSDFHFQTFQKKKKTFCSPCSSQVRWFHLVKSFTPKDFWTLPLQPYEYRSWPPPVRGQLLWKREEVHGLETCLWMGLHFVDLLLFQCL